MKDCTAETSDTKKYVNAAMEEFDHRGKSHTVEATKNNGKTPGNCSKPPIEAIIESISSAEPFVPRSLTSAAPPSPFSVVRSPVSSVFPQHATTIRSPVPLAPPPPVAPSRPSVSPVSPSAAITSPTPMSAAPAPRTSVAADPMPMVSLDEIKMVKDEMQATIGQMFDIAKSAVATAVVILGFSVTLQTTEPNATTMANYVFLLPLLILAAAIGILMNRKVHINKLANYLHDFGGERYKYEKYFRDNREETSGKGWISVSFYDCIWLLLAMMGVVSLLMAWSVGWYGSRSVQQSGIYLAVTTLLSFTWVVVALRLWAVRNKAPGIDKKAI